MNGVVIAKNMKNSELFGFDNLRFIDTDNPTWIDELQLREGELVILPASRKEYLQELLGLKEDIIIILGDNYFEETVDNNMTINQIPKIELIDNYINLEKPRARIGKKKISKKREGKNRKNHVVIETKNDEIKIFR